MPPLTPDSKFKVSLISAFLAIVAAGGFGYRVNDTLSAINKSLTEVSNRVSQVELAVNSKISGLELVMADRWTKSQAAEWALRLVVNNPGLRIPDPRDPGSFLNSGREPGSSNLARGFNP